MMEQTTRCPACGGDVQRGTNKCNQCSFDLGVGPAPRTADKPADYGIALLAIPLVATLLVWFWVGNMNLFQSPGSTLGLIMVATVLGTAGVAAMEATRAGMKTDRAQGTYSPTAWFFIIALLWIIGYPAYLYKRASAGLANRLAAGTAIALVFTGSWGVMFAAVEEQKAEVMAGFEELEMEMEQWERELDALDW